MKCIYTAKAVNDSSTAIPQIHNILIDEAYSTQHATHYLPHDFQGIQEKICQKMKNNQLLYKSFTKFFTVASDIDTLDISGDTIFVNDYYNEELEQFLDWNHIYLSFNLFQSTSNQINKYQSSETYKKMADELISTPHKDDYFITKRKYTFLLSKIEEYYYLCYVYHQHNKIICGWYTSHCVSKEVAKVHLPNISQASNYVISGLCFNAGYTEQKRITFMLFDKISDLWKSMVYGTNNYYKMIQNIFDTNYLNIGDVLREKYNEYNNNNNNNDNNDNNNNNNNDSSQEIDINVIQCIINHDEDSKICDEVEIIASKYISENMNKLHDMNYDPYYQAAVKLCVDLWYQYSTKNENIIVKSTDDAYKLWTDANSSIQIQCTKNKTELISLTIKNGAKTLKIDQNIHEDIDYEYNTNDPDQLHPNIAITKDKIINECQTILSEKHLMNKQSKIVSVSTSDANADNAKGL